jgi:hypothetical protein
MFGVGVGVGVGRQHFGSGASYVGLLDTYPGAAAAYSLRLLKSDYTGNAIRVRRSSDNAEQNIGFDGSGNLDTSTLTSFCGSGNGFVTTWYDQSGNSRDIIQSTAANQPQIVNAGAIIQMSGLSSATPCMQFDGVNDSLSILNSFANTYPLFVFATSQCNSSINRLVWTAGNTTLDASSFGGGPDSLNANTFKYFGSFNQATVNSVFTNGKIGLNISYYDDGTGNYYVYGNNSSSGSNTNTNPIVDNFSVGSLRRLNILYYATISNEVVVYPSNQTSNLSGIKSNINSYYGIY